MLSTMEWTSVPYQEDRRKTLFLIIFLVVLAVGLYFSFGVFWAILAIVLVGGAVLPYFLPTTYVLDETGVKKKGLVMETRKPWRDFRSYYPDKNGVLLSPFVKPSRLENFRGLYVRFKENRKEVLSIIEKNIPKRKESSN